MLFSVVWCATTNHSRGASIGKEIFGKNYSLEMSFSAVWCVATNHSRGTSIDKEIFTKTIHLKCHFQWYDVLEQIT